MRIKFNLSFPGLYKPNNDQVLKELFSFYFSKLNINVAAGTISFPDINKQLIDNAIIRFSKKERTEFVQDVNKIAYVQVELLEQETIQRKVLQITIKFNQFLREIVTQLNATNKEVNSLHYSFSDALFAKIGNNNLEIQENKQSAALMFML